MVGVACESGGLVVSIADAKDEPHPYAVTPDPLRVGEDFAAKLTRRDGKAPRTYRVSHGDLNGWCCDCPDARYGAPKRRTHCKHVRTIFETLQASEVIMAAKGNAPDGTTPPPERQADSAPAAPTKAPTPAAPDLGELRRRLAEPFPADVIGWKPQAVKDDRAMAAAYIDARDVEDRLDDVVGIGGWKDEYADHGDSTVVCTLSLKVCGEWVGKTDVGDESDQKEVGNRKKAAYSDALKRAAVKWGVGRYLYSLPTHWVAYDPKSRQIKNPPALPAWALPGGSGRPQKPTPAACAESDPRSQALARTEAARQERYGTPAAPSSVFERATLYEAKLVAEGVCRPGELTRHLAGAFGDPAAWTPETAADVKAECVAWAKQQRDAKLQRA